MFVWCVYSCVEVYLGGVNLVLFIREVVVVWVDVEVRCVSICFIWVSFLILM